MMSIIILRQRKYKTRKGSVGSTSYKKTGGAGSPKPAQRTGAPKSLKSGGGPVLWFGLDSQTPQNCGENCLGSRENPGQPVKSGGPGVFQTLSTGSTGTGTAGIGRLVCV